MERAVKALPHYTYNDYIHWDGQWEIIDGIPYAMSPLPVPKHQRIASNLLIEFGVQLRSCKLCQVYQPLDYKLEDDTILQPDMLIVCKAIKKKYLDFPPALVVEILSPSTAFKDRNVKFSLYESQKIPYCLIIDPDEEMAEIYELRNDKYELRQKGRTITHTFAFGNYIADINFKEIW